VNGETYVDINRFCWDIGARWVSIDSKSGNVTVAYKDQKLQFNTADSYIVFNDRYLYLNNGCLVEDGRVFLPLEMLCNIFGWKSDWDTVNSREILADSGNIIESGETFYDEDDLYWLAHIINAESGNECMLGKIAVGNVIMNRVNHWNYPGTIYGVIFDFRCGVQFSPAASGSIYYEPNGESWIAAKLVLDGADVGKDSLYFANSSVASGCWAARNRPYTMTIGNHTFFG